MNLKHGSYEVNPPFVPAILTAAAQHMLQLLGAAEASGSALGFVVLMPGWQEVPGWQALSSSSFNRQSLLLAAADHGEPNQHAGVDGARTGCRGGCHAHPGPFVKGEHECRAVWAVGEPVSGRQAHGKWGMLWLLLLLLLSPWSLSPCRLL